MSKAGSRLVGSVLFVVLFVAGLNAAMQHEGGKVDVVVAKQAIAKYSELSADQTTVVKKWADSSDAQNAIASKNALKGKTLLVALAKDGVVRSTDVTDTNLVRNRSLVDVATTATSDAPGTSEHAILVVSPKVQGFVGFVIEDVNVIRKTDLSVTLALRPTDLARLAPVLAVAELRLAPPSISASVSPS